MDHTGSQASLWFCYLLYCCLILSFTVCAPLGFCTPHFVAKGQVNDISPLLCFHWLEPVYYQSKDSSFPPDSREKRGHFFGISEHVGHAMIFKILTDDTSCIIFRSNVCSALNLEARNLCMNPLGGEDIKPIIKSRHDFTDGESKSPPTQIIYPSDLVGHTFLMNEQEDEQCFRARIIKAIEDAEADLSTNLTCVQFICSVNDDEFEEMLSYNEVLNHIESHDNNDESIWKFCQIVAHEGPLKPSSPSWKGLTHNVIPVTCAIYALENDLLDLPGWRHFNCIAKYEKNMLRMVHQAKPQSFRTAP
jgi:hypothetical protein